MLIIRDSIVAEAAIKAQFLYFYFCLSVKLDSLSYSFTSISFLTNIFLN
jgi:hypothetical protein